MLADGFAHSVSTSIVASTGFSPAKRTGSCSVRSAWSAWRYFLCSAKEMTRCTVAYGTRCIQPCCTVPFSRTSLPHVRIDLRRPVFGKARTVKVFLRFPLQQVGRLDVCKGVSAFRQFPDTVPTVVGTGLHQVRFQHPLHLTPRGRSPS